MSNLFTTNRLNRLSTIAILFIILFINLISCENKDVLINNNTTEIASNINQSITLSDFDEEYKANQLESVDYDGYEFKIIARGPKNNEWQSQNAAVESLNGELINDAVYQRNNVVEEKFNVKIVHVQTDSSIQILADVKKAVMAGANDYDVAFFSIGDASSATKQDLLLNLGEVPHINLDASWWDQSIMNDTTVMSKVFFATGDISIMDNDGTWTMMFNKNMIKKYGLEDPYMLVRNGKWTIAKFQEMMKGITKDLNGDGALDYLDQYGFATTLDTVYGLFYSCGLNIINKNADDLPEYKLMENPNTFDVLTQISNIIRSNNYTILASDWTKVNPAANLVVQAAFEEDRSLFYAEVMQCVIRLRQMNTDFGVIPLPKYNEKQESYYTTIHDWASEAAAIPASVADPERSSIILEALAMESKKYLTPAYYEIALKGKFIRDEESAEMLDIIFSGRRADLGYIDNIGSIISDIRNAVDKNNNDFVSMFEKKESKIQQTIQKTIEAYNSLQ